MLITERFVFGENDDQVPIQNFIKDKLFENSRIVELRYNDTSFPPTGDLYYTTSGMKLQFLFEGWGPSEDDEVLITLYKSF